MSLRTHRVVLVCLVAAALATPVVAVDEPRDVPEDTTPPVVVYVGEEDLDISAVERTGGGQIGDGEVRFEGVAGDADGEVLTVDATAADFRFATPGAYDVASDEDDRPEVTVTEPDVTDLVLRSERGVNVTGDTVDELDTITVEAEYDFAEADRLDVTVESPDGIDLTPNGRITESPGSLTVDVRDDGPGTYRVTVEGSELDEARRTVTVTVRGAETRTETATRTASETETETPAATPPPTTRPPTDSPTATEFPSTPTTTRPPTETPGETVFPTATPDATPTTAPGDGLGVVVAVAAVMAALSIVARRP